MSGGRGRVEGSDPRAPWRGPGPDRPALPLPPGRMPLVRGGRPLKRWTYVGAFGPEVMLCAARVRIGPLPVAWWAVWDRAAGRLITGRHSAHVSPSRCAVPGRVDLALSDGKAIEVVSPHGSQYAWTRKRGGVSARGRVAGREVDLRAIVDESAGYHARHTAWLWSAGVGVAESGEPVAWNLVSGIHDDPAASERTVWVGGEPHEVGPVEFADDLSAVGPEAPAREPPASAPTAPAREPAASWSLRFTAEATRARRERMLLITSDYEQPFGAFAGELPVAGRLREGWGVMERHDVRW